MTTSRLPVFLLLCALATMLTGCDAIAGIFKAGAYVGIIAVFVVVALAFFIVILVAKLKEKKGLRLPHGLDLA